MLRNMNRVQIFKNPLKKYTKCAIFCTLTFLAMCTTYYVYSKDNTSTNINKQEEKTQKELPLDISEKHYKREAILKFNEAVKNWESKKVSEAISLWEEAISIDPNLWVAYLGLGQAYDVIKEYSKSLDAYTKYLNLAPKQAQDREIVIETIKYLSHLLKHGEEALKSSDYLPIVKTKHEGKDLYVRWDLSKPLKIYFYPAVGVSAFRNEYKQTFIEGAKVWQEVLPDLNFEIIDNSGIKKLPSKKAKEKEKELLEQAQITVVFPSKFKIKGDPNNPVASQIEVQSFPIIRDKKNFRVLGVIMVSPFIYYQAQIAISLEALSKLSSNEQLKKLKILSAKETGHALGLWGFSPNPEDLMFEGQVNELKLSERDKNTMKKLYELDPEKENLLTN